MAKLLFILSFLGIITYLKCELFNYSTFGMDHVMCKPLQQPGCEIISSGVQDSERDEFLKLHNDLREKVALGNEEQQPKAADMIELVWDNELAMISQRWANQCISFAFKNKRSQKYDRVHQLMYSLTKSHSTISTISTSRVFPPTLSTALQDWYDRVTEYKDHQHKVSYYEGITKDGCSPFTQVVWAKSVAVGCGKMIFKDTDYQHMPATSFLYSCTYGPGGNVMGSAVYQEGDPCSKCEEGCADGRTGLCSNPKKKDPLEDVSELSKTACEKGGRGGGGGGGIEDNDGKDFGVMITSNLFLIVGLLCINILTRTFRY